MFLEIILALITIGVSWVLLKWRYMKTFWRKKGIPHLPVHPLFGSMTFLQKINPNIWLKDIYLEYSSPYVGVWSFWRPGLIVNCPNITRNIVVKDADVFRNRLLGTGTKDELSCLNLFTVNDPLWTSLRRRLTAVFTASKLRGWQELFRSKTSDLIHRIKTDSENGVIINLRPLFADYSTDIIGESSFGIKCESTRTGTGHLREMTKDFEKYSTYRGIEWSSIFFVPEMADIFGFTFWPKHTMAYFSKVFKMIVQERGGYDKETDGKKDLLDALLKMRQDALKDNQNMEEVILISNALIFLQGGYDTTSATLTYLTYELAYHPEVQQRLYEEIVEARSNLETDEFDANDLAELPYFNAVLKETMRKYPIMGWLDRLALKDYRIDEKLTVPAGTVVFINVNGMHHDPKLFPDPNEFRPERFLPENEKNIIPYTYLPFGDGPRSCIGKRFAQFSLRFALAAISTNFIIKPLKDSPVPNDVPVETKGLFYLPSIDVSVEFVPRN
ncbi:cytochrome P450 6k1-like [Anticarsia gemmatalis]|uniref:cytochrome P450 6k1-like n=1 Tax=Anticarsia gemmatalis TaxID=129554 RepID=UPI003F75A850